MPLIPLIPQFSNSLSNQITSTGRRGGRSGVRVYKAGRSPDETKRDEMKRSENERTKRKEWNASNFQNCRSCMWFAIAGYIFSVHFWSSFWGFGAPAKKRPQRRARITWVHFFHAKHCKVLLQFGTISRTWHNFSKDQLLWTNRPRIRAVFLPNSAVCWDLACVFHVTRFEPFWNVRVLVDRFAVQKMPPAESEYSWSGTKKREKKRCLDGWRMHRTARHARKNVRSARKKKKVASPRYLP